MASIKSLEFLPQIFRSETNAKFLTATMDQLTSEPNFKKISGFIGRRDSPGYNIGDTYIGEPNKLRTDYQLEPTVSILDSQENLSFYSSYSDLLQKIAYHGGITDNHSRLFSGTSYNFNSLIDLDKFVNFGQYLWMPNGPPEVRVSAFSNAPLFDLRVLRDRTAAGYRIAADQDVNTDILLTRGETYTFNVDQSAPFWIQSREGLNLSTALSVLSRTVLGVNRNGSTTGRITFNVPLKDAQNDFTEAPSAGRVDFATDLPYRELQRKLLKELEVKQGGIDGVSGSLDGRTLIFVKRRDDPESWEDPGIYDFDPFDDDAEAFSGGQNAEFPVRYNVWRIRIVEDRIGDKIIRLEPFRVIPAGSKVFVRNGKTYAGVEFIKNEQLTWDQAPILTAPLDVLYYQDGLDGNFGGRIRLTDPDAITLNIPEQILGKQNFTSPNNIRFTNGMAVRFDGTASPVEYRNNLYIVEGVGRGGITLVGAGNYVVPESFAATSRIQTPDYITIDRGSDDLNAWTRSNRWFHEELIELSAQYNRDADIRMLANRFQRAQRPIIEFDPNIELYNHGSNAKAMVDILDFTVTNAFRQVEGQELFTFRLPNGGTKDLTAGMRVIFANDIDPDVRNKIYRVDFISTSQGSQLHLVSQDTRVVPAYTVDQTILLENQSYDFVPGINFAPPYPSIGASTATGTVVLEDTTVSGITADFGGLNYAANANPYLSIDTQFIQAVRTDLAYNKFTYLEYVRIVDGGLGYSDGVQLLVNTPNQKETTTDVSETVDEIDYAAYRSVIISLTDVPADIYDPGETYRAYVIGPGIPGGTFVLETDNDLNTITVNQPVTILSDARLIFEVIDLVDVSDTVVVAQDTSRADIITVNSTENISVGQYVSGGKILLNIENITTGVGAVPPLITTDTEHGLIDGDLVIITQITEGPTDLNDLSFFVNVINAQTFALFTDAGLAAPYDASESEAFDIAAPTGKITSKQIEFGQVGTLVTKIISNTQFQIDRTVTLERNTILVFAGQRATATANVVEGEIVNVWITNPGSGYPKVNFSSAAAITVIDPEKSFGPVAVLTPVAGGNVLEYFSITDAGQGYKISSQITATIIDSVDEVTSATSAHGSVELTFATSENIRYLSSNWLAFMIMDQGTYTDFARTPYLDSTTGPNESTRQYFTDIALTSAVILKVQNIDLVNNQVQLNGPINSLDDDGEVVDLPAGTRIHFTCKERYLTENNNFAGTPVGNSRRGYTVRSQEEYTYDSETVVAIFELDTVTGIQIGMLVNDAGNTYQDLKILSIDSFTNRVVVSRNLIINAGTILFVSAQASVEVVLAPAPIKEIMIDNAGSEYTAAPVARLDPIKPAVLKIISSRGDGTGDIVVNNLDGIDIGAVVLSEFQESGFGITTGGDVIRVLGTRSVIEPGGAETYRATIGIARFFITTSPVEEKEEIQLPNIIGLEVGMTLDDNRASFIPAIVVEINSVTRKITLSRFISYPVGVRLRFSKPSPQPQFGDVFAQFIVAARVAVTVTSSNVTLTDINDATPDTYDVNDTVLVATATNPLQTAQGVPVFNQFTAIQGANRVEWVPSQRKEKINQAPLFDVYDSTGRSLGNQTAYPGSKFTGTKIFSYTNGTGAIDSVLSFRLKYKNFLSVGDIEFTNNFYSDSFTYLNNGVEFSQLLREFDLRKYDPVSGSTMRVNQWNAVEEKTKQYQIFNYDYDGQTTFFEIDILPEQSATIPYLKVYLNNRLLNNSNYRVTKVGARFAILIEPTLFQQNDSTVAVKIYSRSASRKAHFEVPVNFEMNPFNSTFQQITLGQMRRHLITMTENHSGMTGDVLSRNNLRDLNYNVWQGSLLQHASSLLYANLFLVDKNADIVSAIETASREYTRFKNRFLDMAAKIELSSTERGVAGDVDRIITMVNSGKTPKSAWYNSDMVPYGNKKVTTSYPIIDDQRRRYEIPEIFNDSQLGNRAVLIYLDDPTLGTRRQLMKNSDFVFEDQIPAITLSNSLPTPYTSFLVIEDYDTSGNFIPETPSKLGLYSKFRPMMYLDTSYQEPIMVIQGHDGSTIPAFNDFRDKLVMELELRIYNNIKADYDGGIFDMFGMMPGKFRDTGYTRTEFDRLLSKRFLKWIGTNRVNYTQNSYYEVGNPWTWNYNRMPDVVTKEPLPGFWRGAYKYFYDTDRPNTTPWEMLGFSEEPVWWRSRYGPAPYTGANTVLWTDLEQGRIVDGVRRGVDVRFARPGLSRFIPVDENGILISPERLLISAFDENTIDGSYVIGDQGPVESAWRKSSDYPYALQIAFAIGFPAQYLGSYIDTSRYFFDRELGQFLHRETNSRISPANISVTDDGVISGSVVHTAGYINWLKDLLVSRGINGADYLRNLISQAEITLSYRMAGYSDKRYLTVIADQSSPGSNSVNIIVPDQNYRILLNKSTPVRRVVYSGVIVEKTSGGYSVSGYDLTNPFFTIIPSVPNNNSYNITVLNARATIFADYQPIKINLPYGFEFRTTQGVVDFLVSYQRFLTGQGFVFDKFNEDLGKRQDWTLSAEEFLLWTQQGWGAGTILALSPVFENIKLINDLGVIDAVENSLVASKVLDQNFVLVKSNQYSVTRTDNQFTLTSLFGQTLALVDLNLVQYEHVMVFDNSTVFGDVLYLPELGIRQTRLKLSGYKTADWTGQLNPPGLIYNNNVIDPWKANTAYRRGSLIKYKEKIYLATGEVAPVAEFDYSSWQVVNEKDIKTGLLPNFASQAELFNNIYDVDNHPVDENVDRFSAGLIGFRARSYMSDFNLDNTSQVKFYQGMIKQKGTLNAINALTKAQFSEIFNRVNVYEDWAVRIGEYGALDSDQQVEIQLDDSVYTENPSTLVLNNRDDVATDGVINVYPDEIYAFTSIAYEKNIIPTRAADDQRLTDIVNAGYPRVDDIDGTLFDIRNLESARNILGSLTAGFKLWVAKDFNLDWNVYRITETNSVTTSIEYSLDNRMIVNTDVPHNLDKNDVISIINFDTEFDGLYLVLEVVGSSSFILTMPDNPAAVDRLRRQQTVVGSGVLFKATSVRFQEINEILDATPPNQWRDQDKIWIDDDQGPGQWGVYQKTDGWNFSQPAPLKDEDVRANDGYGRTVKISQDNQLILVGTPGFNEGSLQGIRVISSGNNYTDPDITVDLPSGNNGVQAIIQPVLSSGEIISIDVTSGGSSYDRPPTAVISDTDTANIVSYFSINSLSTVTTVGRATSSNVTLSTLGGVRVNDYFTNAAYGVEANIRVRSIKRAARSVILTTPVTVPTANSVVFVRDIQNTLILQDDVHLSNVVVSTVSNSMLMLDSVSSLHLDDILTTTSVYTRSNYIRVLQINEDNNSVLLSNLVSIASGTTVTFLHRLAYVGDVVTNPNIGTPFTVTAISTADPSRATFNINFKTLPAVTQLNITHGGGAILESRLEPTTIANVDVIDGGSGFSLPPTLTVTGGGGAGATLRAVLTSAAGVRFISSVIVEDGGSGYTHEPTVTAQKDSSGREAVFRVRLAPAAVDQVLIKSDGANFRYPSITFANTGLTGSGATAEATVSRNAIAPVTISDLGSAGGIGYTAVPRVRVIERNQDTNLPRGSGAVVEAVFSTGIVRCFSRTNSLSDELIQIANIRPPLADIRDYGYALDIGVELAAVSGPGTYRDRGMVVINRAFQSQWTINQMIPHPLGLAAAENVRFGEALAMSQDENWLYVGAPGEDRVYVYAKRSPYQGQLAIDYDPERNTYWTGFSRLTDPRELRVIGNSGRVYEPGSEYVVDTGNIIFDFDARITDLRIYITRSFIDVTIRPTRQFGVLQREYTLDCVTPAAEALLIAGSSGTVYVLGIDYEVVDRNVVRFLNTKFDSEVSLSVTAPGSYYQLHETLHPGTSGTRFGDAISTNVEGYQVLVGAPLYTDTVSTTAAASSTGVTVTIRNIENIKPGYRFTSNSITVNNAVEVMSVDAATFTVTVNTVVLVTKDESLTLTSPAQVGKAYLYDRNYERIVQSANRDVTRLTLSQTPTGPTRVVIGRNVLNLEVDYSVFGQTLLFKRPVPYGSAVKVDINRFVLLQEFNPPAAVSNGRFGKTVDITDDNRNVAIGMPFYREDGYYSGVIFRYINQALEYGSVQATRVPDVTAGSTVLKFNDVVLRFGGIPVYPEGGLTSAAIAATLNDGGIVGLTAGAYSQTAQGSAALITDFAINLVPEDNISVKLIRDLSGEPIAETFVITTVPNPEGAGAIYQVDGVNKPVLTLVRGGVYTFDQSDASNVTHQIAFKDGAGNAYTTGVVTTGPVGQAGAQTVFTVPLNAPANLRYYCVTHGNNMGNTITVQADVNYGTFSITNLVKNVDFVYMYSEQDETWKIRLDQGLALGQTLLIQTPLSFSITRRINSLDILPAAAVSPAVFGYDIFALEQTIRNPSNYQSAEFFGSRVKFDDTGETMLISSEGGTTLKKTTLDKGSTTVDRDSTRLIDVLRGSGAVYVFDYLPTANPSLADPARFLYNQNFQNAFVNFLDNFGTSIDINNGWAVVGADRYDDRNKGLFNSGIVHVFRNTDGRKAWTRLRSYSDKVDIDYINQLLIYDSYDQVSLAYPDYIDPNKGKILGIADQEIDYKTSYDPAFYTNATRVDVNFDTNSPWIQAQVGEVWWNLDPCRFIEYEQGSLIYRSRHWGELFPGSIVEICEWVQSSVLPSQWVAATGDGEPKYSDDSAYTTFTGVEEGTGMVRTYYYFWVKNKRSIEPGTTRVNSVVTIARMIEDPANSGQPYMAVIAPNAFSLYGLRSLIKGQDSILRIEYSTTREQQISHNEFELLAENDPLSIIPTRVLSKLIDSISGENTIGEVVPDPFLISTSQVGIGIRPRQSMFVGQLTAIKVAVDHLNGFFRRNPIGDFIITRLETSESEPEPTFYQTAVDTYETLTYIDKTTVYDGYRILVRSDETVGGFWTIYLYIQATDTYFLERIQNFDTTRYWSRVDWYAQGFNDKTPIDLYLTAYQDIQKVGQLVSGQVIRLARGPSGGWEYYSVDADLRTTRRVAQENGTIQFSNLLYENVRNQVGFDTGGYDTSGFSKTTSVELRNILEGVINDIMVDANNIDLNRFFFIMVYHAMNEQKQLDWITKTSFMSALHQRDQLRQVWNYTKDNETYYQDFIEEVKPYRTKLKTYLLDYTTREQASMVVTDFDLPAIYDKAQNKYVTLDPADNIDVAIMRATSAASWLDNFGYAISAIQMLDGGSGYVNPVIVFSSPTGSGADADVVTEQGAIVQVLMEAFGEDYRDIPGIEIIGSTGAGFIGVPVMGVYTAQVTDGGSGYQVGDIISYTDQIGTAVFTVTKISVGGVIDVVDVTSAGEFNETTWENVTTNTTGRGLGARLDLSYMIVGIDILTRGEGYVTNVPRVLIEGGGGTGAIARASVKKGQVQTVFLIDTGFGYKSTPTVRFVGSSGSGATAHAVLQAGGVTNSKTANRVVRSITTRIKFDRTAYTSNISRWKPLITYHTGDIVVIPDTVLKTYVNLPDQLLPRRDVAYTVNKTLLASEILEPNQFQNSELFTLLAAGEEFTALDRIAAYNRPGSPDRGAIYSTVDLSQFDSAEINSRIVSLDNEWRKVEYSQIVPPTHEFRYAAVGNRTTMAVSRDGINWIDTDLRDLAVNLRDIAFINSSLWVAFGNNGTTFETEDGINWNRKLIDIYYYSPSDLNPQGEIFSPAAAVIDLVGATAFKGTFANYALVVGDKGTILLNTYGTDTQNPDRWIGARIPSEIIEIQYMFAQSRDFGNVQETGGVIYNGEVPAAGGDPLGVNKLASGYFYIVPNLEISQQGVVPQALKKGLVVVGGVNGHVYFATVQSLEDLANGYITGYNYDTGKGDNPYYPWIRTVVPRKVRGNGDGYSGEHISKIVIGDEPDVWTVAVGSGGTLLWNCVDMFVKRQSGQLLGTDTLGKEIISYTAEVFVDWREFEASNFELPLTKQSIINEDFTDITWDEEKFIAVTDSNLVFWGFPGSKAEAYFDISSISADLGVQSRFPAAQWIGGNDITSIEIVVPFASLTGIPSVGQLIFAQGFPDDAIVTAVGINAVTVGFASTTIGSNTTQRLTFVYGLTQDIAAGAIITFTGYDGGTKSLTVSRAAAKRDTRIYVSNYADVAANWVVTGTGIPAGARVKAVGKFAAFTWKLAPGSVRSSNRGINSVISNTNSIELSQSLTADIPAGTVITFFDADGSRYEKSLEQTAKNGSRLMLFETALDLQVGYSLLALGVDVDPAGLPLGIPGNSTVVRTKQYIITGFVGHLEKDLADLVPGVSYPGVRVTGQKFIENITDDPDELDTAISSDFVDTALGTRPEDIIIDGGKFIDKFSSHAPEELIPGRITDLLQFNVFTKDPVAGSVITGFKIFSDQSSPAQYFRLSSEFTTELAANLTYLDTEIAVTNIDKLPDPNPDANFPGSVFVNGEKIVYLEIDRENNLLKNIRRGGSRTSIPLLHLAGSLVSDASPAQIFETDFETTITEDLTVTNALGNTVVYSTLTNRTVTQGRIWLDFGE